MLFLKKITPFYIIKIRNEKNKSFLSRLIQILFLLMTVIPYSCQNDEEISIEKKSEAYMLLKIDDVGYDFNLLTDGFDNFASIETTSDGGKVTNFFAADPATMALGEPDEILSIYIQLNDGVVGDYTYTYSDNEIDDVSISIHIPGSNVADFPDYMSAGGDGNFFITEIQEVGGYIEGDFYGSFKDTEFWDGETDYFALPESNILGTFKIRRK